MKTYNPFQPTSPTSSREADIEKWLRTEVDFVAAAGYKYSKKKNLKLRQYVLKFLQIHSKKPEVLDAFIPYLALNIFDRFISRNGLPAIFAKKVSKDLDLLALCCLLLAESFRNKHLGYYELMEVLDFKTEQIGKLQHRILEALEWEPGMRPITPFSFLEHFVSKFPFCIYHPGNINQLIIQSHADIYLAELKPSVIAASSLLVGAREHLDASEHDVIRNTFIHDFEMKEEQLDLCSAKMKEHCDKRQIPIAVVHWDSTRASGSAQPSSSQVIPRTEVAEASWKEKQKLKGEEVVDSVQVGVARMQEFGFAINWVDENEKVAFESKLKRGFFSVKRKLRKLYTKKTTVPDQ